jgi:hypothetical protein
VKALKGWKITLRGNVTEMISLEDFRKMADAYTKKITRSPETARQALIKEGILTKSGRLSKRYS